MVHLVYFAPENLADPELQTDLGANALVSCLHSLVQNCLLLDFSTYQVRESISREVGALLPHVRKKVEALFNLLAKRNRIIPIAEADYGGRSELGLLREQARPLAVDIVIIRASEVWDESSTGVPRTAVTAYAMTDFETRRAQEFGVRHLRDEEMSGEEFIERFLVPFLRYSKELHIIDGTLGRYYFDNRDYRHTVRRVLAAIAAYCRFRDSADEFKVTIHCRLGEGKTPNNISRDIEQAARAQGVARVKVCFHRDGFKHDRCLASEIGVVTIGRGFDFVRTDAGSLNETTVGFGGPDADTLLQPYCTSQRDHENKPG